MSYFNKFPIISYNGVQSRNIILKAAIVAEVLNNVTAFYPYVIPEGYRPDLVANQQYGNPTLDWVVYFSNTLIDPFFSWPMDTRDFNEYVAKKYDMTIYEAQSTVYRYIYTGLDTDTAEDIVRKSYPMSVETFDKLAVDSPEDTSGWDPQTIYEYEFQLNEAKRTIQLVSPIYVQQMIKELSIALSK